MKKIQIERPNRNKGAKSKNDNEPNFESDRLTFAACNNSNKSESDHEHNVDGSHPKTEGAHTHDDGSVHDDHEADTIVKQEQFKVEQDSTAHGHDQAGHKH